MSLPGCPPAREGQQHPLPLSRAPAPQLSSLAVSSEALVLGSWAEPGRPLLGASVDVGSHSPAPGQHPPPTPAALPLPSCSMPGNVCPRHTWTRHPCPGGHPVSSADTPISSLGKSTMQCPVPLSLLASLGFLHLTPSSAPAPRRGGRSGTGSDLRWAEPPPRARVSPPSPSPPHSVPKLDPDVCRGLRAGHQGARLAVVERASMLRRRWDQGATL